MVFFMLFVMFMVTMVVMMFVMIMVCMSERAGRWWRRRGMRHMSKRTGWRLLYLSETSRWGYRLLIGFFARQYFFNNFIKLSTVEPNPATNRTIVYFNSLPLRHNQIFCCTSWTFHNLRYFVHVRYKKVISLTKSKSFPELKTEQNGTNFLISFLN